MILAMPVSAAGMIPSRALRCAHPLLTVLRAAPATNDNGSTYEGEGITATKPAHDWIFSRWNLGGGNGFGNRVAAVSLLLFLIYVAYLILIAVHLVNSIRLKRRDAERALERAARAAQGIEERKSKLTIWWRSMMGLPNSASSGNQEVTNGIELHALPSLSHQAARRSSIDEEATR
jgi:hypothetical protein